MFGGRCCSSTACSSRDGSMAKGRPHVQPCSSAPAGRLSRSTDLDWPHARDILLRLRIFHVRVHLLTSASATLAGQSLVVPRLVSALGCDQPPRFASPHGGGGQVPHPTIGAAVAECPVLWALFWPGTTPRWGVTRRTRPAGCLTLICPSHHLHHFRLPAAAREWGHVGTWLVRVVIAATRGGRCAAGRTPKPAHAPGGGGARPRAEAGVPVSVS